MRRLIALFVLLMGSLAPAALTPPEIVGAWADPRTYRYQQQIQQIVDYYVAYCLRPRTTTYYFDSSGNDSTGDGSQALPWQTVAKANAIVAASSGDIACLFARGDTWTGTVSLSDGGKPLVLFGAWGTGAKPKIVGSAEPTAHGVIIDGDGSAAQNLDVSGWGNEGSAAYCIAQTNIGTDATLIIDCDLNDGANHNQGHINSFGSGGIAICVRVSGGACEGPTSTPFVSYAVNGGNWFIMDDCTGGGTDSAAEHTFTVYAHTGGGAAYVSGVIVRNLKVSSGANVEAVSFTNINPTEYKSPNFAEIGTEQLGYTQGSSASIALPAGWKINCRYQIKPTTNGGFGSNPFGTSVNCIWQVDNSIYSGFNSGCFFNNATASPKVYHSLIHWMNHGAGGTLVRAGLEYETAANGVTNRTPLAQFRNNIYVAENCTQQIRLGLANTAVVVSNAFKGISASGNYPGTGDVELADLPLPMVLPIAGVHSTAAAATAFPDGVRLEFDFYNRPRRLAGQNIGPIEADLTNLSHPYVPRLIRRPFMP